MTRIEKRWACDVLAAFAPERGDGLAPKPGEVDYLGAMSRMLRGATPRAAMGLRLALWLVALSPLWLWGRITTLSGLAAERRSALLSQLLVHRSFAVRELTTLLKLAAAIALLGTASVRERSGYDVVEASAEAESGLRRRLPLLVEDSGLPTVWPGEEMDVAGEEP